MPKKIEITITKCAGCRHEGDDECSNENAVNVCTVGGFLIGCENGWEAKEVSLVEKIYEIQKGFLSSDKFTIIKHTIAYVKNHPEELINPQKFYDKVNFSPHIKVPKEILKESVRNDI